MRHHPLPLLVLCFASIFVGFAAHAQTLSASRHLERDGVRIVLPQLMWIADHEDARGRQTDAFLDSGSLHIDLRRAGEVARTNESGTQVRVCGRGGVRVETHTPRSEVVALVRDEDGLLSHPPPNVIEAHTEIALYFALADGTPVRVAWRIEDADCSRWARREHAFFASIRCH